MQPANRGLDSMVCRTPWHFRAAGMSGLLSVLPVGVQEAHEYNRAIQVCNTDFYWTLVTSSYCVSYRRLAIIIKDMQNRKQSMIFETMAKTAHRSQACWFSARKNRVGTPGCRSSNTALASMPEKLCKQSQKYTNKTALSSKLTRMIKLLLSLS